MSMNSDLEQIRNVASTILAVSSVLSLFIPKVRRGFVAFWKGLANYFTGPAKLEFILNELRSIKGELSTNGGKSLKDLVVYGVNEVMRNTWLTEEQINSTGTLAFTTDENGNRTWSSEGWCSLTGLTNAESLGRKWLSKVEPADIDRVEREWMRAVREKRNFILIYRVRGRSGTISVEANIRAIHGRNDNVIAYYGRLKVLDTYPKVTDDSGSTI